jgi:MoaA/NifB/PqqE/SkfB family radical SAM enzyme
MNKKKLTEEELWQKYASTLPPGRNGEYSSCAWLEGGLAFLYGDVMLCCARGTVTEKHDTAHPSISKILTMRKEIVEGLQNNNLKEDCPCRNCLYLEKRKWAHQPYLFNYITVAHYGKCNIRCKFCNLMQDRSLFNKASISENISMMPFFYRLIQEKLLSPYATINISGGEPALFPEFGELVKLLAPNVGELIIFSNSTLFSNAIYDSFKYGSISLVLSLDSADPKTYQIIKGRDLCDNAWENAKKYASVGKDRVIAKMIIMDENLHDIKNFVNRAKKCGLKMLYYDFLRCGDSSPKAAYAPQAIAEFRFLCLKNKIICKNAQEGYIKDVDDKAEKIFQEMIQKEGIVATSCILCLGNKAPRVDDSVTLSVKATGYDQHKIRYKFLSKYENEDWKELGGYSLRNECQWTPSKPGCYSVCVYVKDMDSMRTFNDYSMIDVQVQI